MEKIEDYSDIFTAMSANDVLNEAKANTTPRELWDGYWFENEVCCLFADENVGKSILATQISEHIARDLHEKTLYYDFELSKKQFEMRYESNGSHYSFSDNLIRVELNSEVLQKITIPLEEAIIKGIEANIKKFGSKFIVIDNISWLMNYKSSQATAAKLMMKLIELKRVYGLSILVLAHTTKRNVGAPIVSNNLSGSKKFANFFDSMFAIGKSLRDPSVRYLKQIKVRSGEFKYDANNVELCNIIKDNAFLMFRRFGTSKESTELNPTAKLENTTNNNNIGSKPKVVRKKKVRGRSELAQQSISFIEALASAAFESFSTH